MEADPITTEIIRNAINSVANEMESTLVRTAYSTIIYEINDFGLSIFDDKYRLLADATGLPLFLGANEFALRNAIKFGDTGGLSRGDIVYLNIPYLTGAHTNDGVLVEPIFSEESLVGYAVVRAHWTDLGGKDAGYILDSTTVHQEGLMIPGELLVKGGVINSSLVRILRANSRAPETITGDMHAVIAALDVGVNRMEGLYQKYGMDLMRESIDTILIQGESEAREALAKMPKGTWTADEYVDNDGLSSDPVHIHCAISISDDGMTVDYTGSSPQVAGPINLSIGMAISAARICFKSVTTPDEPSNGGHFMPLQVLAPEGSIFNAVYPAPMFTIWTGVVALEMLFKALHKALPNIVPTGSGGDLGDPGFYGKEPITGRQIWHQTNAGVGWGASATQDGLNTTQHVSMCTVKNIPIEVIETRLPVLVDFAKFHRDSGGAGEFRGGVGSIRQYRFLDGFGALTILKKSRTASWTGDDGGHPGLKNLSVLKPNTQESGWEKHWRDDIVIYADNSDLYDIPEEDSDCYYCGMFRGEFRKGDIITYYAGGGSGYGDPYRRPAEKVREDVLEGYVSIDAAKSMYGVVLDSTLQINQESTKTLRDSRPTHQSANG